ncbi:nitrogen fixation protein NifM [Endothiovibrio diazotrophicus]
MSQSPIDTSSAEFLYCLLRTAQEQQGEAPAALDDAQRSAVEQTAERAFELERRILASREALGVVVADSSVEEAARAVEGRYEEPGAFHRALAENGLDPEGLRRALAWQLRVEAVLERVAARVPRVSETEAEIYYRMHPEKFQRPERRTVRHILITINEDFAENHRGAVQARLERLAAELAEDPARFPDLAMANSECPSALHGGLIGTVARGKLYPELDRVLFALDEGAISRVVESEIGLHLVWCEACHPPGEMSLAEAMEPLRDKLTERAREAAQREWMRQL